MRSRRDARSVTRGGRWCSTHYLKPRTINPGRAGGCANLPGAFTSSVEAFVSVQAIAAAIAITTCADRPILASEKAVLMTLANYADRFGRQAWPSVPTIMQATSLSRRTVQRALRELEFSGLIEVEQIATNKASAIYLLHVSARIPSRARRGATMTPDPIRIFSSSSSDSFDRRIGEGNQEDRIRMGRHHDAPSGHRLERTS